MSPQQTRRREAIHENYLARGDKAACERKRLCLLADGGANGMAMLNHVDLGGNVEEAIELVAVFSKVGWLHRVKPCWPFEQERPCVTTAINKQVGRQHVAFLSTPIAGH